jgi:hypothetical protein
MNEKKKKHTWGPNDKTRRLGSPYVISAVLLLPSILSCTLPARRIHPVCNGTGCQSVLSLDVVIGVDVAGCNFVTRTRTHALPHPRSHAGYPNLCRCLTFVPFLIPCEWCMYDGV